MAAVRNIGPIRVAPSYLQRAVIWGIRAKFTMKLWDQVAVQQIDKHGKFSSPVDADKEYTIFMYSMYILYKVR